ncbi:sigma-70 family RNA polymerase sigma factor [Pararobbsia alpina]|uniref:ECF RNA polymerase sigma factor SigJ n=1 Tax=Pararobbsia alpina TaxID=621374 RepID=A0A6S7AUG5_9BURK|nr:sigma-70 family RNA polymerase sigma factor [Pararobbsia alpina]CAB3778336.1 hypothetical protein LMG28138_00456 [Pararobbsia alpina]
MSEGLNNKTVAKGGEAHSNKEGATDGGEDGGVEANLDDTKQAAFEDSRRRLLSIAYRMLGSRAEAEDVVQETYLKWHAADLSEVRIPAAWLTTVATRLSIDRLRRLQLESVGQAATFWPEPWLEEFAPSAEAVVSRTSELSYGLLLLLERLSPEERAALVLHEAFDCGYSEIGLVLAKTAPGCRQIVHRAKARLRGIDAGRQPRSGRADVPQHLLERLRDAIESQDKEAFIGLMAEDAQVVMALPDEHVAAGACIRLMAKDAQAVMALPDEHTADEFGIRTSCAMLADRLAAASDRNLGAELMAFNGRCGIALIHECEIVAILYVEARGDWIGRCYLTGMPAHLRAVNRRFDPRAAISRAFRAGAGVLEAC